MARERLLLACAEGHLADAQAAVADGAGPVGGHTCQTAPLHVACANGHLQLAQWLCSLGVHPDRVVHGNWTPLHMACANDHLEVAQWLASRWEVDVNAKDNGGYSPFHTACRRGALRVAKWMAALPDVVVWEKPACWGDKTVLYSACENGHLEMAQWLVSLPFVDVNVGSWTESPLVGACFRGHMEVVRWLCAHPDVHKNAANNTVGWTPFSAACCSGSIDLAQFLYAAGARAWHVERSPLHCACDYGKLPMVQWLAALPEMDVNMRDPEGYSTFVLACESNGEEIARWLSEQPGVDVGSANPQEWPWLSRLQARRSVLGVWGGRGGDARAAFVRKMERPALAEVLLLCA